MLLQARSRLREIHASLLQQQLAREMADVDVEAEMGWKQEDRNGKGEVGLQLHVSSALPFPAEEQASGFLLECIVLLQAPLLTFTRSAAVAAGPALSWLLSEWRLWAMKRVMPRQGLEADEPAAAEPDGAASPAAAAAEAVVEAVEEGLAEDLERADPDAEPETAAEAQLAAVAAIDSESDSEVRLDSRPCSEQTRPQT